MSAVGPGENGANKMPRRRRRRGDTEVAIDCGVPLPQMSSRYHYPFYRMNVGDSFFVPEGKNGGMSRVRAAASYGAKKTGFKFATRTVEGGTRVWRIA